MKQEQTYYNNIKKVNAGEKIKIKCDSDSDTSSSSTDNIIINTSSLEVVSGEKIEENNEMDNSNRPEKKRQLPQIKEGFENL